MKKRITVLAIAIVGFFALAGCHRWGYHRHHHSPHGGCCKIEKAPSPEGFGVLAVKSDPVRPL